MIAFNFLHSERPTILRRVLAYRPADRMRTVLFASAAALAIILGAMSIESYRLRTAVALQNAYAEKFEQSRVDALHVKKRITRMDRLVSLARTVSHIQSSGQRESRQLAEIGNRLPPHAWLTAMRHDEGGMELSGTARDFAVLSAAIQSLNAPSRFSATLLKANGDDRSKHKALHYELHVDVRS